MLKIIKYFYRNTKKNILNSLLTIILLFLFGIPGAYATEKNTSNYNINESKYLKSEPKKIQTNTSSWETKDIISALSIFVVFAIGVINIIQNYQIRNAQKNNNVIENKKKQLHEFYAPLESYLHISYALSRGFKGKGGDEKHTLLATLLVSNSNTLNNSEKRMIKEIINIGESIEKLITEKSGLIVDDELHNGEGEILNLLSTALIHIRILRMTFDEEMYENELGDHLEELNRYRFPKNLTELITQRKIALQQELKF